MLYLKLRLGKELPRINAALERATALLPAPARPVAGHIFAAGGKRLRPFLVLLAARLLGYTGDDAYDLAVSMEMLHAATLLHDDVLDEATTRRGREAAHLRFGAKATILAGDALLATANHIVAGWNSPEMCACFSAATAQTAGGEILEIQHMRDLEQGPEVYEEIVRGKTAWLLRSSCLMGALCARERGAVAGEAAQAHCAALATYGECLGMAFQMVDDAIDMAPESVTGKPTGGDIREGKLTPPIRLYRESLPSGERADFDTAFAAGSFADADIERIARGIRDKGFDTATRALAGEYLDKARAALATLPNGDERSLLNAMIGYVQNREK